MHITQIVEKFLESTKTTNKPPLIVICGPTASGKTALSLNLADKYNGEIISADSRQIYRYMDIGTDKATKDVTSKIPHHLIDIKNPNENYTVADFKKDAEIAIQKILSKGKIPFLVGGTGLYIGAVVENYELNSAKPDKDIREELERELEEKGAEELHHLLEELDPEAASKIHPNNHRYLIRALEINLSTNQPKQNKKGERKYNVLKLAINWDRDLLYERINQRVEEQTDTGLLNEIKTLLNQGYTRNLPSMSGIGYKEFFPFLDGEISFDQAKEQLKQNTRNYAKRQLTWFQRDTEINWLNLNDLA